LYETINSLEGRVRGIVNAYTGLRKTADKLLRAKQGAEQQPVMARTGPRIFTPSLFED
jgi:hypothetical protein